MVNIRPYKNSDEIGIMKLDSLVEEHPWNRRNLANWKWRFKGANPAGKSLVWVAEDKNNILATFAIIPMMYLINGETVKGSHSAAMIVDPKWQNKGLIKFVADKLINNAINDKIFFTYGYPNERAYELHKRMFEYKDISDQKFYYYSFEKNKKDIRNNISKNFIFKKIKEFDVRFDKLWDSIKKKFNAIVIRRKEFLNWRYIDRPDVKYLPFGLFDREKLLGYCVLKLYQEGKILRGHFLDIFTDPENEMIFRNLMAEGMLFLQKNKCHEVNLWLQGSNIFQNVLNEIGFTISGSRPMICRFNYDNNKLEKSLTESKWFFTMGDTLEIY